MTIYVYSRLIEAPNKPLYHTAKFMDGFFLALITVRRGAGENCDHATNLAVSICGLHEFNHHKHV
jgi:hypothetical protein